MNSINDLYRQVIVEHYKNPRNKGLKEGEGYRSLRLKNPRKILKRQLSKSKSNARS